MKSANTTSYQDRLSLHIDAYLSLVTTHPKVRLSEFESLVEYAQINHALNILEAPAEGLILEQLYPAAHIDRADYLKIKASEYADKVLLTDWRLSNINNRYYDAVLSLAPIHHANTVEKAQYVAGAYQALKPNGVLAFGEVEAGSSLHRFLDEFIHQHSFSGHVGQYPSADFTNVLEDAGFDHVSSDIKLSYWCFDSADFLCQYMTQLFALKPMAKAFLLDSVHAYLGISESQDLSENQGLSENNGQLSINWPLRFYRGVKVDN